MAASPVLLEPKIAPVQQAERIQIVDSEGAADPALKMIDYPVEGNNEHRKCIPT